MNPAVAEEGLLEQAVSLGHLEGVSFADIAKNYGTPCYVYSADAIDSACEDCVAAAKPLGARLSYAIKANGNVGLLREIHERGLGFDASSRLEFERALRSGAAPHDILFTGPGKTRLEIKHVAKSAVGEIICESEAEMDLIAHVAKQQVVEVKVGVRVNPDVDPDTHPHVTTGKAESKFGVLAEEAVDLFKRIKECEHLLPGSLHSHVGSQITTVGPYQESARKLMEIRDELQGIGIEPTCLDLGGGFAVGDMNDRPKTDVFSELCGWLAENAKGVKFGFQPGRLIVARAGILLTRVLYRKRRHLIVDAGMTELIRPALYGAVHGVAHVGGHVAGPGDIDVVGPVCESADFLAKGVDIDAQPGELVAVFDAGAYASAMSMEFNGRLKTCEVMVKDGVNVLIRSHQSIMDAMRNEADLGTFLVG